MVSSSRKLLTHLFFLGTGLALMWGVHLIELSVVSFFHFLLDHRLAVIESWVFDRAWELAVVAKVLPVLFLLNFVYLKSSSRRPFREQFLSGVVIPRAHVFVIVVVSSLLLVIFSRPSFNQNLTQVDTMKVIINYFGLLLFFLFDIFFLDALDRMYPLNFKMKTLRNFIYSVACYFIAKNIFLYALGFDVFFGLTFFFILTLHDYLKHWSHTLLYLGLFLVPAIVCLGLDFMWASQFSIFVIQSQLKPGVFFGLYIICIVYVGFSQRRELQRYAFRRLRNAK